MSKLTTAFLGTAHIHTPGFVAKLKERGEMVRVAAVYDVDAARAAQNAQEFGGCVVSDIDQILGDTSITSVVICAETNQHRDLVLRAAAAGKDIFCEKPLGLGAKDALAMAAAIKEAGVTFQTGFFMRGNPAHQFIKREFAAGHLGKITRLRYSNGHSAALGGWFDTQWRWLTDPALAGGGAMLDLGAHPLDLIIDTFVPVLGNVIDVSGALGVQGGRYGDHVDEYGTGLLTFESGSTAVVEASWVDPRLQSPTEIFGTEGQIQVQNGVVLYYSQHVEGADGKTPVTDLPSPAPHAFELFWDSLLGLPLPIPLVSVDQAALGSVLMERIYAGAGRSTTTGAVA